MTIQGNPNDCGIPSLYLQRNLVLKFKNVEVSGYSKQGPRLAL